MRQNPLNKERFHLWNCLEDDERRTVGIDVERLVRDAPVRILQVILEALLQAKPYQALCQVPLEILVEDRMKRRGGNLLNLGRNKEERM